MYYFTIFDRNISDSIDRNTDIVYTFRQFLYTFRQFRLQFFSTLLCLFVHFLSFVGQLRIVYNKNFIAFDWDYFFADTRRVVFFLQCITQKLVVSIGIFTVILFFIPTVGIDLLHVKDKIYALFLYSLVGENIESCHGISHQDDDIHRSGAVDPAVHPLESNPHRHLAVFPSPPQRCVLDVVAPLVVEQAKNICQSNDLLVQGVIVH